MSTSTNTSVSSVIFDPITFYAKYIGKITCAFKKDVFINHDGKYKCNAKRTQFREQYLLPALNINYNIDNVVLVDTPHDILPIEFEVHDNTKEKNEVDKEQLKKWIKETSENATALGLDWCICSHGGTSDYIWICNLTGLIESKERESKMIIVDKIVPKEAIPFLDKSNIANTLVPIIGRPHWKVKKYNYALHEIIDGKSPHDHVNDVSKMIAEGMSENSFHEIGLAFTGNKSDKADFGEYDINSLKITDVMNLAGFKRSSGNNELFGSNPWHSSSGGMNTWVNENKNVAYCFRCNKAITVAKAIGLNESIINSCDQELTKEEFKQVVLKAQEKYGLKKAEYIDDSAYVANIMAANRTITQMYDEINKKHLVLIEQQEKEEEERRERMKGQILQVGDIKFCTKYLKNFDDIEKLITLTGPEYRTIKKELWAFLISCAVPPALRNIRIGNIETDLRYHLALVLPSGKGKSEIKKCVEKIYKEFKPDGHICNASVSALHKDQLIGKARKISSSPLKYEPVYGHLYDDLLFLEEAYLMFTSKETGKNDLRDILLTAADNYGNNLITKRNVENKREEAVQYYPHCNIITMLQPLQYPEEFITRGYARRFKLCYQKFPELNDVKLFSERIFASETLESGALEHFVAYMKSIYDIEDQAWKLDPGAIDMLILYHRMIADQGLFTGLKEREYTNIVEFPLQNDLLKAAAIKAISNLRTRITEDDMKAAFIDVIERFIFELQFVKIHVTGNFDYGAATGALGEKKKLIQYLINLGADSEESSTVTYQTFLTEIKIIYGVESDRQAQRKLKEMKDEKLIFIKQGNSTTHPSKVWAEFNKMVNKRIWPMYNIKDEYLNLTKQIGEIK